MPTVEVLSARRDKVGTIELDPKVFAVKIQPDIVHEAVVMQRASRRQGTAATKEKGQVRGGGKKPWRQKGTGRARAGSSRSPLWRGGGTIFGPHPRSYRTRFPRSKSRQAVRGVVSAKTAAGELVVLDRLPDDARTRTIATLLKELQLQGTVLMVVDQPSDRLRLAARNCPQAAVVSLTSLNVYDLLRHRYLVTTQADLPRWSECWG
jgi:large subunit ribosomal protein L4